LAVAWVPVANVNHYPQRRPSRLQVHMLCLPWCLHVKISTSVANL